MSADNIPGYRPLHARADWRNEPHPLPSHSALRDTAPLVDAETRLRAREVVRCNPCSDEQPEIAVCRFCADMRRFPGNLAWTLVVLVSLGAIAWFAVAAMTVTP